MTILPTKLERVGDDCLRIDWSDGKRLNYTIRALRDACPCATCREERAAPRAGFNPQTGMFPVLSVEETLPIRLVGMKPVGNYAYGIAFSDGHDTGIFTFDLLRQLGRES